MGLLDSLSKPNVSQGLLGLAAGMLNPTGTYGNFGAAFGNGLLGFQQGQQNAQNMAIKKQQMDTLDQYKQLQGQQLRMAMDQMRFRNQLAARLMGGQWPGASSDPPSFGQPGFVPSSPAGSNAQPSPGGAQPFPVASQGPQPAGSAATPHIPSIIPDSLRQPVMFDLMFNGGKGIGDLLKPNIQNVRPGGTVYDANSGTVKFSAPTTNGTQIVYDQLGQPHVALLPGATQATGAISTAKAAGPATYDTQIVNNADGTNTLTTKRAIGDKVQGQTQNQPAPLRNNNPGALMPGGKLASYPTMEAGLQALDDNLASYGKQGVNTVSGVISKWAPPNENDTQAYIKDVATRLGVDPNQPIDLSKPLVRHALGTAIALHESGPGGVFGSGQPASGGQSASSVPGISVQGEGTIATNQALGKINAQDLDASRKSAINATDDLTNIAKEREALAGGTFGGSGAQAKLDAVKFLQAWVPGLSGFDASKVTNTDYLTSTLGKGLLSHAKDLGYNPTDTDATRIEAIIGTIGKDPDALKKIIDYQEMMANRAIQRHNRLVGQAKAGGVQSAFDMSVSPKTGMPGAVEPTPSAPSGFSIVGVR